MITGIYHINVNCSSLERSRDFYEMLGFRVVAEFAEKDNPLLDRGLGLASDTRALFMKLGKDKYAPLLDLVEWNEPKCPPKEQAAMNTLGTPRIALKTKNLDEVYADLKAKGVRFVAEPQQLSFPDLGTEPKFVVFTDPDGLYIELVEF